MNEEYTRMQSLSLTFYNMDIFYLIWLPSNQKILSIYFGGIKLKSVTKPNTHTYTWEGKHILHHPWYIGCHEMESNWFVVEVFLLREWGSQGKEQDILREAVLWTLSSLLASLAIRSDWASPPTISIVNANFIIMVDIQKLQEVNVHTFFVI